MNRDHEAELQRLERKRQSDLAHQTAQIDQEFAQTQKEADLAMKLQAQLNDIKHQTAEREIDRDLTRQRGEQEIRQVEADAEHQREERQKLIVAEEANEMHDQNVVPGSSARLERRFDQDERMSEIGQILRQDA